VATLPRRLVAVRVGRLAALTSGLLVSGCIELHGPQAAEASVGAPDARVDAGSVTDADPGADGSDGRLADGMRPDLRRAVDASLVDAAPVADLGPRPDSTCATGARVLPPVVDRVAFPAMAYGEGVFVVAWIQGTALQLLCFDPEGAAPLVSAALESQALSGSQFRPAIAVAGGDVAVFWIGVDDRLRFTRVHRDCRVDDLVELGGDEAGVSTWGPTLAWREGVFAFSWVEARREHYEAIRVHETPAPSPDSLPPTAAEDGVYEREPVLAAAADGFALAYGDGSHFYLQRPRGAPELEVANDLDRATGGALVAGARGHGLAWAAYEEGGEGGSRAFVQFDQFGDGEPPARRGDRLGPIAWGDYEPAAAFDPEANEFGVAWVVESGEIVFDLIPEGGEPRAGPRLRGPSQSKPQLAISRAPGGFAVVWADPDDDRLHFSCVDR